MKNNKIIGIFLVVFIWTIMYAGEISGRSSIYCCDNLLITIPSKIFLVREILAGRFPLWNPYIFSGTPFLADINLGLLYPANILFLFADPFRGLTLVAVFHILFLGLGAYAVLFHATKDFPSALFGAIAGFGAGAVGVYMGNIQILLPAAWLPWIVLFIIRWMESGNRMWYVLAVLSGVFQIFSGHPQLTYYSNLCIGVLIIYTSRDKVKNILLYYVPVLMLSAVQLMPSIELALRSTRPASDYTYATFGSLHPLSLPSIVLPAFTGSADSGTRWYDSASRYGYTGILPILLSVALVFFRKKYRWPVFLAILFLLLAMGKYTPLYGIFYRIVPGLGMFRVPSHFLYLYTLFIAASGALGMKYLKDMHLIRVANIFGILYAVLWLILKWGQLHVTDLYHIILSDNTLEREFGGLIARGVFGKYLQSLVDNAFFYTIILFGTAIVYLLKIPRTYKRILLIALLCFDLFVYAKNDVVTASPEKTRAIFATVLKSSRSIGYSDSNSRIYTRQGTFPYPADLPGKGEPYPEALWAARIMRPNLNMIAGLSSIDGYASLVEKTYREYWEPTREPAGVRIPDDLSRVGEAGAGYVIDGYRQYDTWLKKGAVPLADSGGVIVFTLPLSTPRVFIQGADGTQRNVQYDDKNSSSMMVYGDFVEGDRVVVLDSFYPGWWAFVDGKHQEIEPYQNTFRMAAVPQGIHTVEFVYRPYSVYGGILISSIGCIVLLLLAYKRYT